LDCSTRLERSCSRIVEPFGNTDYALKNDHSTASAFLLIARTVPL